jgi:hypothetical protein
MELSRDAGAAHHALGSVVCWFGYMAEKDVFGQAHRTPRNARRTSFSKGEIGYRFWPLTQAAENVLSSAFGSLTGGIAVELAWRHLRSSAVILR